ncbi:MAG: head maturation protease, ClpP-related [Flavobacteriaceae bacterium]
MSLRNLPEIKAFERPEGYSWDVPSDVLARWCDEFSAAEADDPNTISIYETIGEDWWSGGGFTAKRMAAALRTIGASDVTVNINSPGGDVFEGFTIYNLLAEHPAKVTVNVMGIAASAASVIAMAGDEIRMGLGTFMMVHNAWGLVIGNRHDLAGVAGTLEKIDGAIADIYEARSGLPRKDIAALMDAETYLTAKEAVDKGFADEATAKKAEGKKAETRPEIHARRRLEAVLAQTGMPRSERRRLIKDAATGMQDAAGSVMQDADPIAAGISRLIETIRY